jgi:trigger factor
MNISKRQTGDLNAIITIELKPEDYQPKVDETIKAYRKSANIPGFRPGHVPAEIIKKKFGKEVLVEELNKMLGRELVNYLSENKMDVLGTPLPIMKNEELIFEEGKEFSFDYEVGLAPVVTVNVPQTKIPYFLIKVEDKMVEDDINDLRRRYGKFSSPEAAEDTSVLYGEFHELDENGEVKEGGNTTTTTVSIEMIRNDEAKKKFIGTKKGDVIRFNPMTAFGNETEVSASLKVDKTSPSLNSDYNFTIRTVNKIEKAELNQELFDKAFGEGAVASEDEFRAKIREGIASYFEKESDRKLQKEVRTIMLEENNFPLPEDFLKRMLKARQEKPVEDHQFEHEFTHVIEDLKWNLITEKIASEQTISVAEEEIKGMAGIMISQQFAQYGMAPPADENLVEYVNGYLGKDENYERLERTLRGQKVFDYLKKNLKLNMIEMPYAEFIEKMQEKTQHELEHNH